MLIIIEPNFYCILQEIKAPIQEKSLQSVEAASSDQSSYSEPTVREIEEQQEVSLYNSREFNG